MVKWDINRAIRNVGLYYSCQREIKKIIIGDYSFGEMRNPQLGCEMQKRIEELTRREDKLLESCLVRLLAF